MNTILIKLLLVAVGVAAVPAASTSACNEDNCLRAVQASAFKTRQGTADCMSYLLTTVTPATSTSTVTVTATATTTDSFAVTNTLTVTSVIPDTIVVPETATVTVEFRRKRDSEPHVRVLPPAVTLAKRQMTVAPSSIPTYASACSGSARYSSACSCVGATKSTTTAPTPITTTTVTVTTVQTSDITMTSSATLVVDVTTTILDAVTVATATVTECSAPTATFYLEAVGGTFDGDYAYLASINSGDGEGDMGILFGSLATASTFSIDASGHLFSGNEYANSDAGVPQDFVFFDTAAVISSVGFPYTTCVISPTGMLQCVNGAETMFETCPSFSGVNFPGLELSATIDGGCTGLGLKVSCV
ncbi:hypothetical protein MMC11_000452 [Xylographa trunciseda]|nr:hypothetical protein [Xylographa trunciseda]